ncbi:Beta-glucosidase 12 [Apostasia shenzhenica]|uniref:Beta-glucosidase 12 n=1 Tax=Apostasia shenzhenica TaxID=1088818 RepID=A0A2I0AF39_9ASPA|nr:Beta-glucosidase 12 [Apostasia shenzhenica]
MALLPLAKLPINGNKLETLASFRSSGVHLRPPLGRPDPNRAAAGAAVRCSAGPRNDSHAGFPVGFVFGAASSAYQVEGATDEGGRGPSIWDTFCKKYPDRSNGDPGAGSYYNYKEDVKRLAELGADVYRFSISWPRILPEGRGKPNPEGIQYYKNLIQELLDHRIEPFVTIFHWDVPQKLENEYGGFLHRRIVEDYKYFAEVCFKHFGDKVKHWITMNEPLTFCLGGYGLGIFAPGRCTPNLVYAGEHYECPVGDSIREPYIVGHNILLAHAEVVQLYKQNYQPHQAGKVGITLVTNWFVPYDNSPLGLEAQNRGLEFNLGWFMDPLKFGDYPFSMKALVRERLPTFTDEESKKLKDSYDFIGINYYTSRYSKNQVFRLDFEPKICSDDARILAPVDKNGVPIGYAETGSWVNVYPRGIKDLLLYVKERYSDPEIYITENGVMQLEPGVMPKSLPDEVKDMYRAQYQSSHLHELVEAIRQGVKVKGYFVWSLLDSFEWNTGYTSKFGLHYVNNSPEIPEKEFLARIPKQSAQWYKWFLSIAKTPKLFEEGEEEQEELEAFMASIPAVKAVPIKKKTTVDSSTAPSEAKTSAFAS